MKEESQVGSVCVAWNVSLWFLKVLEQVFGRNIESSKCCDIVESSIFILSKFQSNTWPDWYSSYHVNSCLYNLKAILKP